MDSKKRILEAARTKVRTSENETTRNIYFHPDLTRSQRNEAFARRESRRLLKAEEDKRTRELMNHNRVTERDRPPGAVGGGGGGGTLSRIPRLNSLIVRITLM